MVECILLTGLPRLVYKFFNQLGLICATYTNVTFLMGFNSYFHCQTGSKLIKHEQS